MYIYITLKTNIMSFLKAVNTEATSKDFGKTISTNKIGTNKGLSLRDFTNAVNNQQCYSFKVESL